MSHDHVIRRRTGAQDAAPEANPARPAGPLPAWHGGRRSNTKPVAPMKRVLRPLAWGIVPFCFAVAGSPASLARERLLRQFDWRNGLPVSYTSNLEQDERGFLWIGTQGGLVRFDGTAMRLWAREVGFVVQGSGRTGITGWTHGRELVRMTADGVEPISGANGGTLGRVRATAASSDGTLWVVREENDRELLRRRPEGTWAATTSPAWAAEGIRHLRPGPGASVLAAGADHVWQIDPSGHIEVLASLRGALEFMRRPDGSVVLGCNEPGPHGLNGRVLEVRHGRITELVSVTPSRFISLVERGPTVWAAFDIGLVALRPGEPPEWITQKDGLPAFGGLFADREGSLWMATWRGLVQFPEPDTADWGSDFPGVGRFVARTKNVVWLTSWGYLLRADRSSGSWTVRQELSEHYTELCVDGRDHLWTTGTVGGDSGFLEYAPGLPPSVHPPAGLGSESCSAAPDGSLWFATNQGLFHLDGRGGSPRAVPDSLPRPAESGSSVENVLADSAAELWVTRGAEVCHAPAWSVALGKDAAWSCERVGGADRFLALIEVPGGSLWASSMTKGIFRRHGERWEPIPASLRLPSPWSPRLAASPSGGVWIVGAAEPIRVLERLDREEGWEVVERLGAWQGLPTTGISDLAEDPDGSIWLSSDAGLVHVPASARRAPMEPPRMALTDVAVDGRRFPPGDPLEVPYKRNRMELRFAGLSFRDPQLVRYRHRLRPEDNWSEPSTEPFFRFVDMASGRYQVEVEATLDGVRWSPAPARFSFRVHRPWFLQAWFFAAAAIAVAGAAYGTYRIRIGVLLRLERQRTRIAMDLHDAVGSGLGSIGILADLAARPQVEDTQRKELTGQVAIVAGELGAALTDIVWSLKPGSASLRSLALYLAERGGRVFPGGATELVTDFPLEWPEVELSLAVRRNVLLIALEALHNAARHANPRRVALGLSSEGRRWRLWVADDGRGMPEAGGNHPGQGHGMGLLNMRTRAEEIGAEIAWMPRPGGGTAVTLVFRPDVEVAGPAGTT